MNKTIDKKDRSGAVGTVKGAPAAEMEEAVLKEKQDQTKGKGVINWGKQINTLPYYLL